MATYMYTSANGRNWVDEDDTDFDFEAYTVAAKLSEAPSIHGKAEFCKADRCTSPLPIVRSIDSSTELSKVPTYIYISPTGSKWDEYEDDEVFDLTAFTKSATAVSDNPTTLQHTPTTKEEAEVEFETDHLSSRKPTSSSLDSIIDQDFCPTYAQKMTETWFYQDSRPAYPELSHDDDDSYPDMRVNYTANWTATKLRMGADLKHSMMMRPSPLQLSKTWVQDNTGEFLEEHGFLLPSVPALGLRYDSSSDEERDEARTPPRSPPVEQSKQSEVENEELYLPPHHTDAVEIDLLRGFDDFGTTAEEINIVDVVDDVSSDVEHVCIGELDNATPSAVFAELAVMTNLAGEQVGSNQSVSVKSYTPPGLSACNNFIGEENCEAPHCRIECSKKAEPTVKLATTHIEATHITVPLSGLLTMSSSANSDHAERHAKHNTNSPGGYTPSIRSARPSPDLKYLINPTNTSLAWNIVAAGFSALSSVPWGRVALATAASLTDLVTYVARR
ncbi:hypothetical protein SVAN01_04003 [Stagonosporopsis vannaccii]|nr:hypothetical protein SVAN01_04003 [Stagonosporopsis vannaccii]